MRRVLGVATIVTVIAIFFGWDQTLFAKGGLVRTASAEETLISRLAPKVARPHPAAMSLDAFAVEEAARVAPITLSQAHGVLPGFVGGTEWINSPELTPESLKGKVVLVDFWTSECYHFGEGRYEELDKVVAKLLAERDANTTRGDR